MMKVLQKPYSWLIPLFVMTILLLTGCSSAANNFKNITREVTAEIISVVVVIVTAVSIIMPMLTFALRIILSAAHQEDWQMAITSSKLVSTLIGAIIGLFIALNAGTIVDAIVQFVRGLAQ